MERKDGQVFGPVLGIESSCDETATAVLAEDGTVLAERVYSQLAEHSPYGGVVPEIAARVHLARLGGLVRDALDEARLGFADLGAVAATAGPGLIGGLLVGSGFAKGAALAAGCRYVAVNHLEAHALTARLPGLSQAGAVEFPYLLLLVSGGHCQCVAVRGVGDYVLLGTTLDDAVGEAFDKTAKLLGLGYPGGPALEALAAEGQVLIDLPRPLWRRPGCDFSFSGLKTAVALQVAKYEGAVSRQEAADIAASFQAAVADILADRLAHAVAMLPGATAVVVAGGVAANLAIRAKLMQTAAAAGLALLAPPLRYCTDNAVMVAWAAIERLRAGFESDLAAPCRPRWPLAALVKA